MLPFGSHQAPLYNLKLTCWVCGAKPSTVDPSIGSISRSPHFPSPPVQGQLAHEKTPTPFDPSTTLGIGLLQVPTGVRFLLSKLPL